MFYKMLMGLVLSFGLPGGAVAGEDMITISGKVTDRNGEAIPKCEIFFNQETWITDNSFTASCDGEGNYSIDIPKGHYNSIYICDEDKYAKTALEFWGWNINFNEDQVFDASFDKLEVYSLAAWNSNGGANTIFASFRPMSVEKLTAPGIYPEPNLGDDATVLDIRPVMDINSITATLDGATLEVKSLQWIYEKSNSCNGVAESGSCYMPVAIIQLERPTMNEGRHILRVVVRDSETGAMGEGATEFTSNSAGYGF